MKGFLLFLALIPPFIVIGCAAAPEIHNRTAPFIQSEYDPYENPGTSVITGQAFMKTRGGDVKYGAGCTVVLNPVTTYSTEWFRKAVIEGYSLSEPDPRGSKYHRQTIADGNGYFEFKNLPKGEYYLACSITWQYYAGSLLGNQTTGGTAYAKTKVNESETVKVIVTR